MDLFGGQKISNTTHWGTNHPHHKTPTSPSWHVSCEHKQLPNGVIQVTTPLTVCILSIPRYLTQTVSCWALCFNSRGHKLPSSSSGGRALSKSYREDSIQPKDDVNRPKMQPNHFLDQNMRCFHHSASNILGSTSTSTSNWTLK